jgi:hypothetical protein
VHDDADACATQQVITLDRAAQMPIIQPRHFRRRPSVWALLGVLVVCLGGATRWELTAPIPANPARPTNITNLDDLGNDTEQQTDAARLSGEVTAMPNPALAAQVSAACDLAAQITRPVPLDVDRWLLAHCPDDQQPHDGTRYDIGPLDHE